MDHLQQRILEKTKRQMYSLIWNKRNTTDKPIELPDSKGDIWCADPGQIIYLPKQIEFLELMFTCSFVAIYGSIGAAKSHILRWATIYFLAFCGACGIRKVQGGLFSETEPLLRDRQWLPMKREVPDWLATFNEGNFEMTLRDEYGGGILLFQHLQDPGALSSVEYGIIALEEAQKNTKQVFVDLHKRLRWPDVSMSPYIGHCPFLLAFNPGGPGAQYLYKNFVDPDTRFKGGYDAEYDAKLKPFGGIHVVPGDNPFLPKTYYADQKRNLSPREYDALVLGNMRAFEGQMFDMDDEAHFCPPFDIPDGWLRVRAIDHGSDAHPTACVWIAVDYEGNYWVYRNYEQVCRYISDHKRNIDDMSYNMMGAKEQYTFTVGDATMFSIKYSNPGNLTAAEIYNKLDDGIGSFHIFEANTGSNRFRVPRWKAMKELLKFEWVNTTDEHGNEIRKITKYPKLRIFSNLIYLREELVNAQRDEKNPDDVYKTTGNYGPGEGDDSLDALSYGLIACGLPAPPKMRKPKPIYHPQQLRAFAESYDEEVYGGDICPLD